MPEHDEAHVRDGRVRDDAFQVGLHRGDDRAVDDADHREHEQDRREVDRRLREQLERETQQAVGAHLQDHARQHHRTRGRRLGVHQRQPRVEREQRCLDRERGHEAEEQQHLGGAGESVPIGEYLEVEGQVTGVGLVDETERERRREQERGTERGVQEELHRRVLALRAPPSLDEEVHRDEHQLPEHEEQDQVERQEDAHDRPLEEEEPRHIGLHPVLDVALGREQTEREQQRGDDDHEDADPVDTDDVTDPERGDPSLVLDELEVGRVRIEVPEQPQRKAERDHRGRVADRLRDLGTMLGHEHRDDGAGERHPDDRREDREVVHVSRPG